MGLAIVVWTLTDNRVLRALFWVLAAVIPIVVALSRLYRGMHHASDVVASVLLAAASLTCAVMVTRVSTAAAADTGARVEPSRTSAPHEVPA